MDGRRPPSLPNPPVRIARAPAGRGGRRRETGAVALRSPGSGARRGLVVHCTTTPPGSVCTRVTRGAPGCSPASSLTIATSVTRAKSMSGAACRVGSDSQNAFQSCSVRMTCGPCCAWRVKRPVRHRQRRRASRDATERGAPASADGAVAAASSRTGMACVDGPCHPRVGPRVDDQRVRPGASALGRHQSRGAQLRRAAGRLGGWRVRADVDAAGVDEPRLHARRPLADRVAGHFDLERERVSDWEARAPASAARRSSSSPSNVGTPSSRSPDGGRMSIGCRSSPVRVPSGVEAATRNWYWPRSRVSVMLPSQGTPADGRLHGEPFDAADLAVIVGGEDEQVDGRRVGGRCRRPPAP